jgi:hypothetical protein
VWIHAGGNQADAFALAAKHLGPGPTRDHFPATFGYEGSQPRCFPVQGPKCTGVAIGGVRRD